MLTHTFLIPALWEAEANGGLSSRTTRDTQRNYVSKSKANKNSKKLQRYILRTKSFTCFLRGQIGENSDMVKTLTWAEETIYSSYLVGTATTLQVPDNNCRIVLVYLSSSTYSPLKSHMVTKCITVTVAKW